MTPEERQPVLCSGFQEEDRRLPGLRRPGWHRRHRPAGRTGPGSPAAPVGIDSAGQEPHPGGPAGDRLPVPAGSEGVARVRHHEDRAGPRSRPGRSRCSRCGYQRRPPRPGGSGPGRETGGAGMPRLRC